METTAFAPPEEGFYLSVETFF